MKRRSGDTGNPFNGQPWYRRKWPRSFSIRNLLVLTLLLCLLFAWIGEHFIRSRTERSLIRFFQSKGGIVYYDYETPDDGGAVFGKFRNEAWAEVYHIDFDELGSSYVANRTAPRS